MTHMTDMTTDCHYYSSMWISNAATAAMMVPILFAVLAELGLSKAQETMMILRSASHLTPHSSHLTPQH